jgi:hypothetical protein
MSFSSSPLGFIDDISKAVGSIRLRLLGHAPPPPVLYHYTKSFETVLNIGNSRALRATCAENLTDTTEIDYGAKLVHEEVQRKLTSGVPEFPQMVLEGLHSSLIARKRWTFVACFCAAHDSAYHWTKYGKYCLGFDTRSNLVPQLRPGSQHAEVQYYRAIYRPCVQREAIRRVIDSITDAAVENSSGVSRGPWKVWIANFHARNASQLLMDLIASFKNVTFRRDKEWRVVCRPHLALNTAAPDLEQDNFRHLVKENNYVELQTSDPPDRGEVICAHSRSAIPFSSINRPTGFRSDDDERRRVLQMLEENGRPGKLQGGLLVASAARA